MVCTSCNRIIPGGSVFCTYCGARLEINSDNMSQKKVCNACNHLVPSSSAFCIYCGYKLNDDSNCDNQKKRIIIIERADKLTDRNLVYQIILDDKTVATIRRSETKAFEIDENAHLVQCRVISPQVIAGAGYRGMLFVDGGGGVSVSDIIRIPEGDTSAELFVEPGYASLQLKLVRYF